MSKMTISEAARHAGVTRQTIWVWCKDFKIGERLGSFWVIDAARLEKHMEHRSK